MDDKSGFRALNSINDAYLRWCGPLYRKYGLKPMALEIILFLARNPELCTASDMHMCRGYKENVLSVNVAKLVDAGYLQRRSVDGDRRKVQLVLTEKAAPVAKEGLQVQDEFGRRIREGLTGEELAVFRRCMDRAVENAGKIRKGREVS